MKLTRISKGWVVFRGDNGMPIISFRFGLFRIGAHRDGDGFVISTGLVLVRKWQKRAVDALNTLPECDDKLTRAAILTLSTALRETRAKHDELRALVERTRDELDHSQAVDLLDDIEHFLETHPKEKPVDKI